MILPKCRLDYTGAASEALRASLRSHQFGALTGGIAAATLRELQEEARHRLAEARLAEQAQELSYRARVVSIGEVAKGFLGGPEVLQLLQSLFGETFALTESCSCLTFYGEGDHLGPHLDKPANQCCVTVLAYLAAVSPQPHSCDTGLALRIYGPELNATRDPPLTIPTTTGSLVIGRGARIWHERPMLKRGERVTALTGCYSSGGALA